MEYQITALLAGSDPLHAQPLSDKEIEELEFSNIKRSLLNQNVVLDNVSLMREIQHVDLFENLYGNRLCWFNNEKFLCEAMKIIVERSAFGTFCQLMLGYSRKNANDKFKLISVIKSQDPAFLQQCGTYLFAAAIRLSQIEMLQFLLDQHGLLNINLSFLYDQNTLGQLICGSSIDIKEKIEYLKVILEKFKGFNLNAKDNSGETLLTLLCTTTYEKYYPIVEFLLENGANPFICSQKGHSPMTRAFTEARKKLLTFGGGLIRRDFRCPADSFSAISNVGVAGELVSINRAQLLKFEIIFILFTDKGIETITTLKRLKEILDNFKNLSEVNKGRLEKSAQFIFEAPPENLAPGVLNLFKEYFKPKAEITSSIEGTNNNASNSEKDSLENGDKGDNKAAADDKTSGAADDKKPGNKPKKF